MTRAPASLGPFLLETLYQPRIWGGYLMGDGREPIGEAWGAFSENRIASGPLCGMTLGEACLNHPDSLLGRDRARQTANRFPILTKLLETCDWLSVQLHPNDEQATRLEGPGHVGKTEAWHLLETAPDTEIILGLQPGTTAAEFADAIRNGWTLDVIARQAATAGDTWFIPAGTVHALGPGMFLYEVQQASDITYRVFDWDRPASAGRALHIEQAIACIEPTPGQRRTMPETHPGSTQRLASCPYFALDRIQLQAGSPVAVDTGGETFHAVTAIGTTVRIKSRVATVELLACETVIVPASSGAYVIESDRDGTVMIASSPPH